VLSQITSYRALSNVNIKDDAFFEDHACKCSCHFATAVLYVAEGRQCPAIDSQVRQSFLPHQVTDTDQGKVEQFRNALRSITDFHDAHGILLQLATELEGPQKSSKRTEVLQDLASKVQALLPLEFEAAVHLHTHDHEPTTPISFEALSTIISKAQRFLAPLKTYALFADIVLSGACTADSDDPITIGPSLPLPATATLLTQIITAVRTHRDYDTVRASRWIRCLVQLCLDHHNQEQQRISTDYHSQQTTSTDHQQPPPLQIIEDITTQAIILARQSLHRQNASPNLAHGSSSSTIPPPPPPYPPEELEWLSTTLFNLGIDFYVYKNSNNNNARNSNGSNETSIAAEAETEAKKWTSIALEIADVLAEYPASAERGAAGDKGLLGRVLRGKMRQGLGWVI
jgi:hypothetical protein